MAEIQTYRNSIEMPLDPDVEAEPYPPPDVSDVGMAIEFRNVTFEYSGSKARTPAVQDVSFTIPSGALVVIVGANGSGKTSLVRLLTRQHAPSTGEVIVDGGPAASFRLRDLREATALLSQDHSLFGSVSIAEDIGMGRWSHVAQGDRVTQALRLGGAHHFVTKLRAGTDTVLHPISTKGCSSQELREPIQHLYDRLEKSSTVSGGEKQRLVAARTFFRIYSDRVRLVVVDEPSAAMDPAGEYELFKHLREARAGKTMVFITHRFGHLTKHADIILCMKDGRLVEYGTHRELVTRRGEYFDLYNVQAQAFATESEEIG